MKNRNSRIRNTLLAFAITSTGVVSAATVSWTNTSGGDWGVAANWDAHQTPGAADTAVITKDGTYTVNLDVNATIGSLMLGGLSGVQTLAKSSTTLALNNSSVVNTNGILEQNGGELNGGGLLILDGVMNWTGGFLSARLTVSSNGMLNLGGTGYRALFSPLTNVGLIRVTGTGQFNLWDARIENLASGVVDFEADAPWYGVPSAKFRNWGVVRKSGGSNTTFGEGGYPINFENAGSVTVLSGTLNFASAGAFGGIFEATATGTALTLTGGGTLTGSFVATNGATITLAGGVFTAGPTLSFLGAGATRLAGGVLLSLNELHPNLQLLSGAIGFSPSFQGGTITNFTLNGVTLLGSYTVTGTFNWLSGIINDGLTLAPGAVMILDGNQLKPLYGPLTNSGTVYWRGAGNLQVYKGYPYAGAIWNQPGGAFNIENDQIMNNGSWPGFFVNAGTVRKSSNSGITQLSLPFTNSGTLRVESGTVEISDGASFGDHGLFGGQIEAAAGTAINFTTGGQLTGNFTAASGATINLVDGNFSAAQTLILDAPGTYRMTGGHISLIDGYVANLQMLGGSATMTLTPAFQGGTINNLTLAPSTRLVGDYSVSGALSCAGGANGNLLLLAGGSMNWSGGTLFGALSVAANAQLNLTGPEPKPLYAALTNAGIVNWSGAGNFQVQNTGNGLERGKFVNTASGVLNILNDQIMYDFGSAGFLENDGLIVKSGSVGNSYFTLACTNRGTVKVVTGIISFLDTFRSGEAANFSISLGGLTPGTDYGRIQYTNTLAAVGTMTVSTHNGFRPNPGDTFEVLSYQSATNEFTCINGLDLGGGLFLIPQFGLTSLTLLTASYDYNNVQPQLFLTRASGGLSVTWPFGFPGWVLESTTNLDAPVWEPVPVQCNNQAVVPIVGSQKYFRLKQ